MNLIIMPGAASPNHVSSEKSIQLLSEKAKSLSFNNIEVVSYPGHNLKDGEELEPITTIVSMKQAIIAAEAIKEEYIVFVRSYGCNPFLKLLTSIHKEMSFCKRVIIWGVSSYHYWKILAKDEFALGYEIGIKHKGVRMSSKLFTQLEPVENSIQKIKGIKFPIRFFSGELDRHSPRYFYEYLKNLSNEANIEILEPIKGVGHTVESANEQYFNQIFC